MKRFWERFGKKSSVSAVVVALVLGGTAVAFTQKSADETKARHPAVTVPLDERPIARDTLPQGSYAPIVKKVTPAVVKIVTTITLQNTAAPQMPFFNDPFWRRFFGDQFGHVFPQQPQFPQHEWGIGSGVIVSKNGYILTNNHVVDDANHVQVTLQDGRQFTAKVVGRDPDSDIAVVKIKAHDLPVVPMADSDKVQVGDVVLAIGNPFGVGETVTRGIVSATGRGGMGIEDYEDFIQTDAAINPGNSGGALVDVEGRLVGINTAIYTHSGGFQGIGFAIPSDLAHSVMESLIKYGHVTRGYIGAMLQVMTPELAKEFGLNEPKGALVADVAPDGPADKAGLKSGDVILSFNGKQVKDRRHLRLQVAATAPGKTVPMKVLRDGSTKTLDVTLKPLPGSKEVAQNGGEEQSDNGTLNGVVVSGITPQARQQFNIPDDVKGALITEVDPNSPSAQAGLKPGQVIEEINHHSVTNAEEAVKLTEHPKSKVTLLRVWSNGGSQYIVVDERHSGD